MTRWNSTWVAEGIETEEQLTLLRLVQCEFIQGFYVSRPIPANEVTEMLERLGEERQLPVRSSKPPLAELAASA